MTSSNKLGILQHIRENAKTKDIHVDYVNGDREHVHCNVSLNADQAISKVIQLIKGESSFWINKNNLAQGKFEWADDYYAVSISESQLPRVREYIKNQEEHHRKKTWQEECDEFMEKYGLKRMTG